MANDASQPAPEKQYRSKHRDPNYKGEKIDKELEKGPVEKRTCRDILCCILFLAYCAGMVAVSAYALSHGNPSQLVAPYDSDGNQCGYGNLSDYKYLYFAVPFPNYINTTVCTKACPSYTNSSNYPTQIDCYPNSFIKSCTGAFTNEDSFKNYITQVDNNNATPSRNQVYIYNSTGFVDRYCVPTLEYFDELGAIGNTTDSGDVIEKWVSDIEVSWTIILASLGIAFIIGLIYMVFVRWCSGVLVWLSILALIAGCIGFGVYLFSHANYLKKQNSSTTAQDSGSTGTTSTATITTLKVFAYILWALAGITVLLVCCLYKKIKLTIGILKAAADYVKATWTSLLVPIGMIIVLSALYVYWIFTAVYLYSCGTISQRSGTPFGSVTWDANTKRLLVYHLFGGLWVNAFTIAFCQLVLAGSVALWYFNIDNAHATVRKSLWRAFRYHFGSVAFGSFIVAVIQMIRIIWAYIQKKLKPYENKVGGCLIKYAVCYITYCLDCFERYIRFINKNAYIQIALEGKSFLGAAISAFYMIVRNGMMLILVGGLGEVFIAFGKWMIALATAGLGYIILTQVDYYSTRLYSALMPAFIMLCIGFAVGALFMSVYGMAADTILQCYILTKDLMSNHGVYIKPPSALRDFIDNNQEVKKHDEGHGDKK